MATPLEYRSGFPGCRLAADYLHICAEPTMNYILPFIVGMVVTMAWLPLLVRLAKKWLIIDHPGERKVHSTPIPRVGGLAMAIGVLIAALLTMQLQAPDVWFLVAAAVLITFGVLDDRFDLDYRIKLIGQLLAVSIAVFMGGVQIHAMTFDERLWLPDWVSMPLTVFFLVGVTNAINLADGLDGLAGGHHVSMPVRRGAAVQHRGHWRGGVRVHRRPWRWLLPAPFSAF